MPDLTPVTEMIRAALDLTPDLISDEVNTKTVFIVGHGHG